MQLVRSTQHLTAANQMYSDHATAVFDCLGKPAAALVHLCHHQEIDCPKSRREDAASCGNNNATPHKNPSRADISRIRRAMIGRMAVMILASSTAQVDQEESSQIALREVSRQVWALSESSGARLAAQLGQADARDSGTARLTSRVADIPSTMQNVIAETSIPRASSMTNLSACHFGRLNLEWRNSTLWPVRPCTSSSRTPSEVWSRHRIACEARGGQRPTPKNNYHFLGEDIGEFDLLNPERSALERSPSKKSAIVDDT